MIKPQVTYYINPSFQEGRRVSVSWNEREQKYQLSIEKGFDTCEPMLFEDCAEINHIMTLVGDLKLPLVATGVKGLHGNCYELNICYGTIATTFNWCLELPSEWSGLVPIIKSLESLLYSKQGLNRENRH